MQVSVLDINIIEEIVLHSQPQSVEDVIRLTCEYTEEVDKKEQKRTRTYNYTEIRELQSKLTLVAGDKQTENKDTINRFDEVGQSGVRLRIMSSL